MDDETATKQALMTAPGNQREHVTGIVDGLSDEQWHRPLLPSGWTPAALVMHLALDVERWWFVLVMAGDLATEGVPEVDGWHSATGLTGRDVVQRYTDAWRAADEVIAAAGLSDPPACWPTSVFGTFRLPDLRAVLLHVTVETACHAGHLDAARELLDGRQWLVLD